MMMELDLRVPLRWNAKRRLHTWTKIKIRELHISSGLNKKAIEG